MRRDKPILYARDSLIILVISFALTFHSYHDEFHSRGVGIYNGLFHTTAITHIFHMFIFIICLLILQLNGFYSRKISTDEYAGIFKPIFSKIIYYNSFILNKMSEQFRITEYPLMILFVIIGGIFLMSSCDLISLFLSIELQSYGLYLLCSTYRNSEKATSAGLIYFLLGGLSSCFILLGSGLLYGNSGNTIFDDIYIINNISSSIDKVNTLYNEILLFFSQQSGYINYINISFVIISVGFLFKVTAAPFHFWSPDVYDSIPTVVTTFVAIFAKISIFILLLELVHYTSNSNIINNSFNSSWTFTLLISSLLSLIIGSVMGLAQSRIKRLYAYSTISHVGFILLALSINKIESIQSFIFYLMQYSISNLNAFILLIAIGYTLYIYNEQKDNKTAEHNITDKKNSPIQLVSQLKGYFYINPAISLSLAITIFSFVGIPPLVGFFAKQMVLSAALDNGYVFMAIIAILTSVISAYYYLAVVKQIFFNKTDYVVNSELEALTIKSILVNRKNDSTENLNVGLNNVGLSGSISISIASITLVILLFILTPQEWLSITNILSLILFFC